MSIIKKIDAISVPAVENSLALFDLPPSVVSYNKTYQKELLPLNSITREGPFHFRLHSDSNFVDLSRTYIQLTTSIERESDGNWIALSEDDENDKKCSVIQNFTQSFIRQLKLSINSVEVYNSSILYPFLAYINREFFTPYDFNRGLVATSGYVSDRQGRPLQDDVNNAGFEGRRTFFAGGRKCVTFSRLGFELANQPRLLLPNSDVIFSIWAASDRFLILAPTYTAMVGEGAAAVEQAVANPNSYRIKVHDIRLYTTLVDVVQSLQNSIAKQLEQTPAKYPIRRLEVRNQFMSEGQTNLSFNCFQSVLPRRVLVFFVNNTAFDGNPELSPFKFEHANVQSIAIESGGVYVPATPYMLDFSADHPNFLRAYWDFHKGLGEEESALELSTYEYLNGYCGFCFDLRSFNKELGDAFELIRNSTTVLKVQLAKAVEDPGLQVLVIGEFDSVITINADRIISTDGSI